MHELKKSCQELKKHVVRDTAIWRWREEVVPAVGETLRQLGFFGEDIDRQIDKLEMRSDGGREVNNTKL